MFDLTEQRAKQILTFESYLKQMIERHEDEGNSDCYIVFTEEPPDGHDVPHLEQANAKPLELVLQASDSAAAGSDFMDQSSVLVPNGASAEDGCSGGDGGTGGERYVQFAFPDNIFYMELPNVTLFPAEAERLLKERSGFYFVRDLRQPEMPMEYWQKLVKEWDPVHKVYLYSDSRSAAEDMAFIFYNLWKFPPDWQFYYRAGKFSGDAKSNWEGEGPVK